MKLFKISALTVIVLSGLCSCSSSSDKSSASTSATPAEPVAQPTVSNSQPATPASFTCTLDGVKWEGKGGNYSPYQYYAKGNGGDGQPYIQLGFVSTVGNGDELLLVEKGFKGTPGVFNGDQLSASFTGNGKYLSNSGQTFSVEITKWEKISDKQAKVSGKASGTLKSIKNATTVKMENGEFTDLVVDIL